MHPKALLDACAELVKLTLQFQHPADAVVSRYFRDHRNLGPRERATLAETAYTVLRKKTLFEAMARSGSGPKERRLAILGFHAPRNFLQAALSDQEIKWLQQCDAIQPEELMAQHRHNLPQWMADALQAQVGDQFEALAASMLEPAPLDLRVNTLNAKRDAVQKELAQAGIKAVATPYSPWGLRVQDKPALTKLAAFQEGRLEVQDEGSQLLALLLDAKRGEMVVDFCAGAGGKTLAIGAQMRNTGRLYAFDVSAHRLEALKPRLARSGLSNVHPAALAHERDERVKRLAGKIDRVLVDAPCSGLGTLRRNPDLKWRQDEKAVAELNEKQLSILTSAARMVKSGGRLVYATCSVLPEENEHIAEAFQKAHPDFVPLDAGETLAKLKVEQAEGLCAGGETGTRYVRLWPHTHQTDGFFAAVWERK
ncbi:RsmB/NOP family class I SAM-dependent RNA methyltransferase [Comamonas jiangduensis]|uniref:RsmB/NOP family class I SAM-dependent RNA methyltransferase n=1 Tax=Comamonas jiangduensis TaxID=1194168 RepID=UPI003BF7BA31